MKYKELKMYRVFGLLLGFFFVVSCIAVMPGRILAGGKDKEITGNRGYLVGTPTEEGIKAKEKKPWRAKRGKLEIIKSGVADLERHIQTRETDKTIPEKIGDIGPKGYLVGTPKEKPLEIEKEKGKGGFAAGFEKAMEDLREFNAKFRDRPYPADQSLEGTKGGYIYGEPPAVEPEPEREITRTQGIKPDEILPRIGKGIENLHRTWSIKPHRSTDKKIWGFRFPDMPKKEKKGITRHKGDPVKTIGGFIETIGADVERHKAAAPVDK